MTIERLIKDTVDDMGQDVPARTGLADDVLHRARRGTHVRRTAVASGVTVAAMAGAAVAMTDPLSMWSTPSGGASLDGAQASAGQNGAAPQGAADAAGEQGTASPTVIELAGLDAGAAPAAPWYADGAIHLGDTEVPFDVPFDFMTELEQVEDGAVALIGTDEDGGHDGRAVYHIRENGEVEKIGDSFITSVAVSADGMLVAWGEHEFSESTGNPVRTTVHVYDVTTGEVVHSRTQEDDQGAVGAAVGFLDSERVVLNGATNSPSGVYIWHIVDDTVTQWTEYGFVRSFAPSGTVGAFVPPNNADDLTTSVVDAGSGEALWNAGHDYVAGFSPQGHHAALLAGAGPSPWIGDVHVDRLEGLDEGATIDTGDEKIEVTAEMLEQAEEFFEWEAQSDGRRHLVIADAGTGDDVARFEVPNPTQVTWESGDSVVFEAREDDQAALVRCTVTGECELATEPRSIDMDQDTWQSPYLLDAR